MKFQSNPALLEVNINTYLEQMKGEYGEKTAWADIPHEHWQNLGSSGYSLLWLMGLWERSPGSRMCALSEEGLLREYGRALPGWNEDDVIGSPYAVHAYSPDPAFGSKEDLAPLRESLNHAGIGLIVDFVPNHMSLDHPWTLSNPDRFIRVTKEQYEESPFLFTITKNGDILAHGKDPYFPPWKDTVQINYFSTETRTAMINELMGIAGCADGVRCDMAMLVLNSVFEKTWGNFLKEYNQPANEFWKEAIHAVKKRYPSFLFIAEAYWDLEWKLQEIGFDYTYDKKLYDLLLNAPARRIHEHLWADESYQKKSVRFIENHDEPRAVTAFGRQRSAAAAVIAATVPGMHFFHEGQHEGSSIRLPVQLRKRHRESPDPEIRIFYERLLAYINHELIHSGIWNLIEPAPAWNENPTYENLLSWIWQKKNRFRLIVVNYSDVRSQGKVYLPKDLIHKNSMIFHDCLTDTSYKRKSSDLLRHGLYIDLHPWQAHLFELKTS